MHFMRMLICRKVPTSVTLQYITECKLGNTSIVHFLSSTQCRQFRKTTHVRDTSKYWLQPRRKTGLFEKWSTKFDLFKKRYQLMALGCQLYDDIPDHLNYTVFFKDLNMPDTFYSWFLITELHVWMLMLRFTAEGEKGKEVVRNIVEAMWHDVIVRSEQLGPTIAKYRKKQIMQLSHEFNAAIIDYDEGIMSDDKILAGALWRRFFCMECNNPEHVERILIYVRKQTSFFDKIPSEKLFHRSIVQWIDLPKIQ
ncbi:ubiquinol-cytochrome c reductase complex assembly factor 1 [Xylocopa sonorina]|uniref:ubiquinol-cytochrome c reductase complex assembly factor 1 n=1 Tax=Xylocopa sonorina TaxID=1818115 RepID=UPI00403B1EE5